MRLVRNWRSFWRWHTTWVLAFLGVLPLVWTDLPPDIKSLVPAEWRPGVLAAVALGGIVVRLRDQGTGS